MMMKLMVLCPSVYEEAISDSRMRLALILVYKLLHENPWLILRDPVIDQAVTERISQWPQTDRELIKRLMCHLRNNANADHWVILSSGEECSSDPVLRAHEMARDEVQWLIDKGWHHEQQELPPQTDHYKSPEVIIFGGLQMNGPTNYRVFPPTKNSNKIWTRDQFASEVWSQIFRWTESLHIYDRNLVTYWNQQGSRYPNNLEWIIRTFKDYQAQGHVMLHLYREKTFPKCKHNEGQASCQCVKVRENIKDIERRCKNWQGQYGLDIQWKYDLPYQFHDRYFWTQQGWWRSHRGIDLSKFNRRTQNWVMENDVELVWQDYRPPLLLPPYGSSLSQTSKIRIPL
ncbi:hypothetical protein [Sulfobacillus thermosulfidooxidans]|nr:hypothetical protein [Sulfobacillus thermosulfidooxidans]